MRVFYRPKIQKTIRKTKIVYETLPLALIAAEVIPMSRSLMTGIQYLLYCYYSPQDIVFHR
jgi:hypothetical protein